MSIIFVHHIAEQELNDREDWFKLDLKFLDTPFIEK